MRDPRTVFLLAQRLIGLIVLTWSLGAGLAALTDGLLQRHERRPLVAAGRAPALRWPTVSGPALGWIGPAAIGAYLLVGGGWIGRVALRGLGRRCLACGYDLRAATAPRCPECGATIPDGPASDGTAPPDAPARDGATGDRSPA